MKKFILMLIIFSLPLTGCDNPQKDIQGKWTNGLETLKFEKDNKVYRQTESENIWDEGTYKITDMKNNQYKLHKKFEYIENDTYISFSDDKKVMKVKLDKDSDTVIEYNKIK